MNTILEKIVIFYFMLSIIIEILDLIFYFTFSKEDDKIFSKIENYWSKISKVVLLLSIRTPITILLLIILSVLTNIVDFIKRK